MPGRSGILALIAIASLAASAQAQAQAPKDPPDPQAHVLELVQAGKCAEAHDAAVDAKLDSLAEQITQMCGYKPSGSGGGKGGGGRKGGAGGRRGGGGPGGGAPPG